MFLSQLILQHEPGKKSNPGKAWLKVRSKSLQLEVDRMLGLVYNAVREGTQ